MLSQIWEKLQELAFPVSEVERKTTGLFLQVLKHTIKVTRYIDPLNCKKHVRDIKNWLNQMSDLIHSSKSRVSKHKLIKWYNISKIDDTIHAFILRLDDQYTLQKRYDTEETIKFVKDIVLRIIDALASDSLVKTELKLQKIVSELEILCKSSEMR